MKLCQAHELITTQSSLWSNLKKIRKTAIRVIAMAAILQSRGKKEAEGSCVISRRKSFGRDDATALLGFAFFFCDLFDRFKANFPISNLPRGLCSDDSLKPFAIRVEISHPVSTSASLVLHLQASASASHPTNFFAATRGCPTHYGL
jgi:hypothetical protein